MNNNNNKPRPLTTTDINTAARRYNIKNFVGTFALDQIPIIKHRKYSDRTYHFVVNTQTHNLPGQHWIGVTIRNKTAYIFDPFGSPPSQLLIHYLKRRTTARNFQYNKKQLQPLGTVICGHLVIQHLLRHM